MPYQDPERQREYRREWFARRRAEWIAANGPCTECGSPDELEVDHVDPATKVTHNVWSWSAARREVELAKCHVLCRPCHRERTSGQQRKIANHGTWQCYGRGCRDDLCRAAWAAYRRELRESRWTTARTLYDLS